MNYIIAAAIAFFVPYMNKVDIKTYSKLIVKEAREQNIDPLWTVAFIHEETGGSWNTFLISKTWDHGLMQIHVSKHSHPEFLGIEHVLFAPEVNIRIGTRLAGMWKRYHEKHCRKKTTVSSNHPWWAHMKWGFIIKNAEYADTNKIGKFYNQLRSRFVSSHEGEV